MHSHWTAALIALINILGKENVYVSIYEYGSTDNTKDAVAELKLTLERMVVNHTVVSDTRVHEEEVNQEVGINEQKEGWIVTKNGKKEMRRLPLLADLKNKAMAPLEELRKERKAADFDRILWLGSVVFTVLLFFPTLFCARSSFNCAYSISLGDNGLLIYVSNCSHRMC